MRHTSSITIIRTSTSRRWLRRNAFTLAVSPPSKKSLMCWWGQRVIAMAVLLMNGLRVDKEENKEIG